ncbi:MAG: NifB/NifX family molybdenum-iron cluster-binding protein [Campylobacterota bacterium]
MIALPIAKKTKTSNISPLFGKAKQFAIFKDSSIEVVPNELQNGKQIVSWLKELGVDTVILKHLGKRPFMMLHDCGIDVYFCDEKLAANEAVLKMLENRLIKVTPQNYDGLLGHEHSHGPQKRGCSKQRQNFVSIN